MRAARVDANHAAVVDCLRRCGCVVQSLAAVGCGVPDILAFHRATKRVLIVEIKDGKKEPARRRLTPDQVRWHAEWQGAPVYVIESVDEALALLAGDAPR